MNIYLLKTIKYFSTFVYKLFIFELIFLFLKNGEYQNYLINLNEINSDIQKINQNLYIQETILISAILSLLVCLGRSLKYFSKNNILFFDIVIYLVFVVFLFSNPRFSLENLLTSIFIFLLSIILFEFLIKKINRQEVLIVMILPISIIGLIFLNHHTFKENIEYLQIKDSNEIFLNQYISGGEKLNLPLYKTRNISNNDDILRLKIFDNCCYDLTYEYTGGKPGGFIDEIYNTLIFLTGDGRFFRIENEKKLSISNSIKRTELASNIREVIIDENFYQKSRVSIRGVKSYKNSLYFSYIDEMSPSCFSLSVARATFNFNQNTVDVSNFYQSEECLVNFSSEINLGSQEECAKNLVCLEAEGAFNLHSTGGQIEFYDGKMILAVGEFGVLPQAQNDESIFGKVISINLIDENIKVISKGHRNIQGMAIIENNLITTEHGPTGGDEINLINLNRKSFEQNYGWPVSSYGDILENKFPTEALVYKSHEEYNFIEPLHYFSPSIGISSVGVINTNEYLVGSLKANKLFIIKKDFSQKLYGGNGIQSIGINIGDRIRDIHYYSKENLFILVLETRPAIAILELNK
jgi:hypothetical protein